jgi:methionyl-tRNA formyltransferase
VRIIFAGTPEFAAAHLRALFDAKHEVVAVYTQPDRPAGRGKKLTASAVKSLAQANNIPVEQPPSLKSADALSTLQSYNADVMIVVAYGLLLPKAVLDTPKYGCINVHGSLLPKWRGAAPIQRAIWAGDEQTGIAVMQMDEGLDTGDVLLEKSIPIQLIDTSASVYRKLAELGPSVLLECIAQLSVNNLRPQQQDNRLASYAKKLSKVEAKCDWHLSCHQLSRNVRAFNPWPMAWFEHQHQQLKIHTADAIETAHKYPVGSIVSYDKDGLNIACRDGLLSVTELQLPGKKAQKVKQMVNGNASLFSVGSFV